MTDHSNESLLDDMIRVAKTLNCDIKSLSYKAYNVHGRFSSSTMERRFGSWNCAKESAFDLSTRVKCKTFNDSKRDDILKKYSALAGNLQRPITGRDLVDAGITYKAINGMFAKISDLDQEAREKFPDSFYDTQLSAILQPKNRNALHEVINTKNKFVITTAVLGCKIDEAFYNSLKYYCSVEDATLLILTSEDPAHNRDVSGGIGTLDRRLSNEIVVCEDTSINNNLFISTIKVSAKQIDPITGLGRIGQRDGSFIYASPKQRLQFSPVSNNKLPHALMTTGAITLPSYTTTNYMSERTAYIAEHDHGVTIRINKR